MNTYKDELLMHYGIKGQKKGRRRFQNEDGSLTPAGKLRYSDPSSKRNSGSYVRLKEDNKKSDAENGYLRTNSIWPEVGEPGAKSAFTSKPAHGSTVNGDSHVQLYSDSKNTYERYYNPDGSIEERVHSKDGKTTQIRKWKKDGTIIEDGTLVNDSRNGRSPILNYENPTKGAVDAVVQTTKSAIAANKQHAAESERYHKMTEQGRKQIDAVKAKQEAEKKAAQEAEKYRKMTDKFRRESAAKAKQRLTPEKADKVKKALTEKRAKKAVAKPKANKNRREEIQ